MLQVILIPLKNRPHRWIQPIQIIHHMAPTMAQCNAPFCCLPEARIASLNPLVVYIPTPNSGPHQRNNTPLGKVPLRGPWKRASDLEDYGVEKTVKPSSLGVKTVRVFSQKYRGVSSQFRLFLCGANRKFVSVDSANGRPCRSLLRPANVSAQGIRWSQWMSITGLLADTYWWF